MNRTAPGGQPDWRSILQLVRAPAVFTAISNIIAAHLLAVGSQVQWRELVLLCGASALIYSAGMVLNDCFDYAEDARERPSRPLPSGRIRLDVAWASGWFLLAGGIALAGSAGWQSLSMAGLLALCVVLYDGLLRHGLGGALTMGSCRYLNWLLGFSFLPLSAWHLLVPIPVLLYVAALSRLAQDETRALDRQPLRWCVIGLMIASAACAALIVSGVLPNRWASIPLAAGLALVLHRLSVAWQDYTPGNVQAAIGFLLFGIVPLDAWLVFAGGHWWGALVVLALLLPGRMLARVMYVT